MACCVISEAQGQLYLYQEPHSKNNLNRPTYLIQSVFNKSAQYGYRELLSRDNGVKFTTDFHAHLQGEVLN
jgi:hypothetical protein